MTDYTRFTVSIDKGIANVRLSCPDEYNKMTTAFWRELPAVMNDIDRNPEVRVVLLSAEGKHFCAGLDLSSSEEVEAKATLEPGRYSVWLREHILSLQAAINAVENARMPVIAAVQRACIGGGLGLITACDMRYCSEDAFFSIEEINIGIACDIGSLQRLPYQISDTHLREWAYSGRKLPAAEALQWGLVGAVYADQSAMLEAVQGIAAEIASKSPLALQGIKKSLNYSRDHSVADGLDHIATLNGGMLRRDEMINALKNRKAPGSADYGDLEPRIQTTKGL